MIILLNICINTVCPNLFFLGNMLCSTASYSKDKTAVFVIARLRSGFQTVKDWFGKSTTHVTVGELYADVAGGNFHSTTCGGLNDDISNNNHVKHIHSKKVKLHLF